MAMHHYYILPNAHIMYPLSLIAITLLNRDGDLQAQVMTVGEVDPALANRARADQDLARVARADQIVPQIGYGSLTHPVNRERVAVVNQARAVVESRARAVDHRHLQEIGDGVRYFSLLTYPSSRIYPTRTHTIPSSLSYC